MDLSAIYSKTPKGLRARASLIGGLSSHLMKVLTHVDGNARAESILSKFEKLTPQQLSADITKLEQEGYIRLATITADVDDSWALTVNFEPMQVEEYISEAELEAAAQAKATLQAQQLAQQKAEEQAKQEQKRLLAVEKAEKKAQKLKENEKIKAEAKVQAQFALEHEQQERERLQQEQEQKKRLAEAAAAAEAAEAARKKAEAEAKSKAEQAAQKQAQQQAQEQADKLAQEVRHKAELKAREAAEQAQATAEAAAKEQARREIERISRESEETQKKQELEAKATQEAERLEAQRLAEQKAAEKAQQEKLKNEAIEQEKLAKEQARLEIANVLRKAEEARKQAAIQAKAEKLEEKRKAKAEQEARQQAERKAKEDAKDLAKQQKLKAQAEIKAKIEAAEQAQLVATNKAKAAEKLEAEAALQIAAEKAERLRVEQLATELAQAKLAAQEQAALKAKENAQLEMERIGREAELARQTSRQSQALEIQVLETQVVEAKVVEAKEQMLSLNDFDAAEAAEEAAFAAEEQMAEAEKKIQRTIEKKAKQATEDTGRIEIKNAAIANAKANASVQDKSPLIPTKKIKQWLRLFSKFTFVYIPLLLIVLVGLAHFINLRTLINPIQQIATESIGKPVSIEKVHASLWPQPHLVLEQVAIDGGSRIKAVHVLPVVASLFEETKQLKSLVLDGMSLDQSNVSAAIDWAGNVSRAKNIKVEQINLKNLTIAVRDLQLESFDGKVNLTDSGTLNSVELVSSNNALSIIISPQATDYAIDVKAANWQLPFGTKLIFNSLNAKGVTSSNQIKFSQLQGEIYGGNLTGQASIQWPEADGQWQSAGDFKLENANAGQLLNAFDSAVMVDGKLALNGSFYSKADNANQLAEASVLNANFDVRQGDIQGIELARAVMSRGGQSLAGNNTNFDKLIGTVQANKGQYQFGKLQLNSSQLNANGYINIAANQTLSGRVSADLAAQSRRLQAKFAVSGRGKDIKSN